MGDQDPQSDIELPLLYEQRLLQVLLDHERLRLYFLVYLEDILAGTGHIVGLTL